MDLRPTKHFKKNYFEIALILFSDMDEEAKVPFHEHVFLDHLIEDFPKTGPVRVFMELVILGLSKNPYMTVKEKHDHVDWFRKYFEEKKEILDQALKEREASIERERNAEVASQ